MTRIRLGLLVLGAVLAGAPAGAAVFVVDTTADGADALINGTCAAAGAPPNCTLRAAIMEANAAAGPHTINFAIAGAGPHTVTVSAAGLPAVGQAVTINGYSQPGASANTLAVGNDAVLKIELDGTLTGAGANGLTLNAAGTTIRGLVINRFADYGILVNATGAVIRGNFIGTNALGSAALGNSRGGAGGGIGLRSGTATIGGTAPADRNLVSGNVGGCARNIELSSASSNTIQGNYVGTNAAGTASLSAGGCAGIGLEGTAPGSNNNLIGGTAPGAGNLLSGNGIEGVAVLDASTGNAVLGNSIYGNGALGIDLAGDGVTNNDPGDGDGGPNSQLNFPDITAATVSGGSVSVSFLLEVPAGSYRIEFFRNPSGGDPLGYGEGQVFTGFKNVNHPGGAVAYTQAVLGSAGDIITATTTFCTDGATCAAFGSTSEFSATELVACCSLSTTTGAGTITVTAPASFEMVFNTLRGGGIDDFFDLAEDPTRTLDLAGKDSLNLWGLFHSSMEAPAAVLYTTGTNSSGAKLDLLEATATRVKVRQESFYQRVLPATAILPGVKGIGDYSVYGQRVALRWNRRVTATVPDQDDHALEITVHREAAGVLNPMGPYSQGGSVFPAAAGDDFVLAQREVAGSPGARTDFLGIQYSDWPAADSLTASPTAAYFSWRDTTDNQVLAAGVDEKWNFLVYYKPTNFLDNTDSAVIARSADYRGPSAITVGPGTQWQDADENSSGAGDFFNESEAAYVFNLDPVNGLTFDMDGSATTRYSPFFKIRQWRSFVETPTVTLEGSALRKNVDYRAALKPVSRAHLANSLYWHCTLQDAASCGAPDVGSGGGVVVGASSIVPARYGNGLSVVSNDAYVVVPQADFNFSVGALEFWYQPTYNSTSLSSHMLWNNTGGVASDYDCFWLEHTAVGNLVLRAYLSADDQTCGTGGSNVFTITATSANYSWRAGDWVHLRAEWNSNSFMRLLVNGAVAGSSGAYSVIGFDAGQTRMGSCQITCPGGIGSTNANGIIDEPNVYGGMGASGNPETLGYAGVGDGRESFASSSLNATLLNSSVVGGNRGQYLYMGADSRFRGLNVALATPGAGVAAGALVWQYWRDNGAGTEGWANLEAVAGFGDGTVDFTRTGTVKWDADPVDWKLYSVNGGPDLYYVRVYLSGFPVSYSTPPVERQIKTDILLFQHCGDVTAAAQTFAFAVPPTTEVTLSSLAAVPGDASVTLEWRTGSELRNLGFHVYRGLSDSGPWTRLTSSLIAGLGSSAVGQAYSFRDSGLVNGTRYFYRLEDVDAASKATSHGPVSAVPSAAAAGAGGPGDGTGGAADKRKSVASATCPDWVIAAYGSSVGSDVATASLRCTRYGDPEAVALGVVARDSRSATLELRTGGFYALSEPSGTVRVFVPGFDFPQDERAAALPIRRALADAVVGRRVQLGGVRALELVSFKGLVPSALGKAEMQVGRDGTVRAVRRGGRAAAVRFPKSELATLLPSVFQGETKSAVVEIAPLRFDPQRQQLLLAKRVRVRLLFTGRETGESGKGSLGRAPGSRKPASGEILARLYTTNRGLYAASFEQLFPGRLRGFAASQLRLERQGEPVGFHLEPASDGFGPGSRLYFFAERTAASTDFSAELAYELMRSRDGVPMPIQPAAPGANGVTTPPLASRSFETNRFYQPGLLAAPDLWLWEALGSGATRVKSFSLSGVAGSGTAELEVFLQGASESGNPVDHHVSVSLNGALVGEAQFAGKQPHRIGLNLPASLLREGANDLSLTNVADTGVSSFVFLDRFSLAHPQTSSLTSGLFEGTWPESGTATVSGAGAVVVVDVTGAARWLSALESSGVSVRFRAEAGHRYLVASEQALLTPRVAAPEPSTLRAASNQADYILVAPRAFLAAAEPLLQRRQDQGFSTRAAAFEEIAGEFGHGQASAEAIKAFLTYAFQSWARPSARYVLLLGDSSYDPRNFIGTSQPSPLPALWAKTSYLWTVSDPQLAAVNGDDPLPDLAIGRLPAATVEQAQALVAKLLAWEDSGQGLDGAAALVADNPDVAGDFEADVDDIRASFLASREARVLKLSALGAGTRPAILDALNSGLSLLSYVGHGGAAVWASENVWNSWDAPSLQAQSQQPFLITMNCLNGYFVAPAFDSLAESLLKAEGRGAIASFSPSGLSVDGPAHQYHRALMAALTSGKHARLGDAVLAAQKAYAETGLMPELLGVYHLLGDPAMRIVATP